MKYSTIIAIVALFVLCGCRTNQDACNEFAPKFVAKREQFKKIAEILKDASPDAQTKVFAFNPKPFFDVVSGSTYADKTNTEIVMYEQLEDPDITGLADKGGLSIGNTDLLHGLMWTGEKSPLNPAVQKEQDVTMSKQLAAALSYPYLIVYKVKDYKEPQVRSDGFTSDGFWKADVFFVDLRTTKIVLSFPSTTVIENIDSNQYGGDISLVLRENARIDMLNTLDVITESRFAF